MHKHIRSTEGRIFLPSVAFFVYSCMIESDSDISERNDDTEMEQIYDVIILGAGPAGLSAGLYAGRSRLSTLIIERGIPGGQIMNTNEIENYPGQMLSGETGFTLIGRMQAQAEQFGAVITTDTIVEVTLDGDIKALKGTKGTYHARHLIIATGARPRPIGCKNEEAFVGRGISYCATCDANFFRGLDVYVAGGGDAAVEEALFLTRFARKVTVIHRRDTLRAVGSIQEEAFANPKMAFLWDSVVEEVYGDEVLSGMWIKNVKTGERTRIEPAEGDATFGLFGFIGNEPNSGLFEGILKRDDQGYILTDENMCTCVPGVYAAGDVRAKSLRQVVTAVSDGAVAAMQAAKDEQGI